MPRLPVQPASPNVAGSLSGPAFGPAETGGQVAQGLAQLGDAAAGYSAALQQQKEAQARDWSVQRMTTAQLEWTKHVRDLESNTPLDAPDVTPKALSEFDAYAENIIAAAPTTDAQHAVRRDMAELRTHLGAQLINLDANRGVGRQAATATTAINTWQNVLRDDPSQYAMTVRKASEYIDAIPAPAAKKELLKRNAIYDLSEAALRGMPVPEMGRQIHSGKWDDKLAPGVKEQLIAVEKQHVAAQAQEYREGVKDYIAYAEDGHLKDDPRYTPEAVRAHLKEPEASAVIDDIKSAQDFGAQVAKVQFATPDELVKMVAAETAQAGGEAPGQDFLSSPVGLRPSVGVRNNNPGNIKDDGTEWVGKVGTKGGFVVFDTYEHGVRALRRDLTTKIGRGVNTISGILEVYAPRTENDTDAYIADVTARTGIEAGTILTPAQIDTVAKAIIVHENGVGPGAPAEPSAAGPDNYRREARQATLLQQAIAARARAIKTDPAAYVQQADTVKDAAALLTAAVDGGDQSAIQDATSAYASAMRAEQQRIGVRPDQVRLLTKEHAAAIVGQFNRQPTGGQTAADTVQAVAAQWGPNWPDVYREMAPKLPSSAVVIASMTGRNPAAATALAEASAVGRKDLTKSMPNDEVKAIDEGMSAALGDFHVTVSPMVGGERTFADFYDAGTLLALKYHAGGLDTNAAVERAYSDIMDRYNFYDTVRVPKTEDDGALQSGMNSIINHVEDTTPDVPAGGTLADYSRALKHAGYFVTLPDESGVALYNELGAVVTVNGKPLTWTWDDLRSRKTDFLKDSPSPANLPGWSFAP